MSFRVSIPTTEANHLQLLPFHVLSEVLLSLARTDIAAIKQTSKGSWQQIHAVDKQTQVGHYIWVKYAIIY